MTRSRPAFPGFPPEAIRFFRGLKRNNNREWFQARKQAFEEQVRAPMIALVEAVNASLARFAPEHIQMPEKAIYRIYRDTRFSSDKTPYKDHIAATFSRRGLARHGSAGFYFSVSHHEIEVAGGVYMPGPDELRAIRLHLAGHHDEFRRMVASKGLRTAMGELQGSQLVRPPKGFLADGPAADLLRYKQLLFYVVLDASIATTPNLLDEIVRRFRLMAPFVEFLNAPLVAELRGKRAAQMFV